MKSATAAAAKIKSSNFGRRNRHQSASSPSCAGGALRRFF